MDNYKYKQYRGCSKCKLDGTCEKFRHKVKAVITKNVIADNWGSFVTVFKKGEKIIASAVIKESTLYCICGKSKFYENYEDFIDTDSIRLEEIIE